MPKTGKRQQFGWIPDLPDQRDHVYAAPLSAAPSRLPPRVDLSAACPPVYDQGALGSCTANAIAGAFEYDLRRQKLADLVPSRLFIYYNERVIEHTVDEDSGAMLRDGIRTIAKQGVCPEGPRVARGEWPYDIDDFARKPPAACYAAAKQERALVYRRISHDLDLMKACLFEGFPFVFGVAVYDSFPMHAGTASFARGHIPLPAPGESGPGPDGRPEGHAMLCVGYDDAHRVFLIRNSWGRAFGARGFRPGYGTIPYAYLTSTALADDFWTVRVVSGPAH